MESQEITSEIEKTSNEYHLKLGALLDRIHNLGIASSSEEAAPIEAPELTPDTAYTGTGSAHDHQMKFLANMCRYAYEPEATIKEKWNKKFHPRILSNTGILAFLSMDPHGNLCVAFRGTAFPRDISPKELKKLLNLLFDIITAPVPFPAITKSPIYVGFLAGYLLVRDQLHHLIKNEKQRGNFNKVYISGHSLGGAIANLCAIDLLNNSILSKNDFAELVTFGQPQTGMPIFNNESNRLLPKASYRRYVNGGDPIPYYPNPIPLPEIHGGTEVKVDHTKGGGKMTGDFPPTSEAENPLSLKNLKEMLEMDDEKLANYSATFPSLNDHKIDNYYNAVAKIAG